MNRYSRKFPAAIAAATFAFAGAAHADDTSNTSAQPALGFAAPHTLTIEVCHPDQSGLCTRDRALLTENGTFEVNRTTDVPYKAVEEHEVVKGKDSPHVHFGTVESGFTIKIRAQEVGPAFARIDYLLTGSGIAAMRDVTAGNITTTYPSTEANKFTGSLKLQSGEPALVSLGLETVKLTLDAK